MKNKKAQIGKVLLLIVSTIIVIFILTVFFFLGNLAFKIKFKKQAEISKLINENQMHISLKSFLNSEIKIEGSEGTIKMVDLIRLYYVNESYKGRLIEESEKIFEKFEGCYFLTIDDIEMGNSWFSSDVYILPLPITSKKSIEISLATDNKCLEEKNEN